MTAPRRAASGTAVLRVVVALVLATIVGGCSGPILANPPAQRPIPTLAASPSPTASTDPQPVVLPRDDAPHDRLTEWWYYTGHLRDRTGRRYGFEFVVFRAERGSFPVAWASHFAITDEGAERFVYAQRSEVGPQVDRRASDDLAQGFDFALTGPPGDPRATWSLAGGDGTDRIAASFGADEASDRATAADLSLDLRSTKPPALHDHDGWIDFGPAGGSYYYSRTRMSATGRLSLGGQGRTVDGEAWFDHQWGDFIAVGGGGWDWFAVNLNDGSDLTLSLVRDRDGNYPLVYGTLVDPAGTARHLDRDEFDVHVLGHWTSPVTGVRYPSRWRVSVPGEGLVIELRPTVAGQELDTRATSGVVYWEGSQRVNGTRRGAAIGGEAYVELTGYGPG